MGLKYSLSGFVVDVRCVDKKPDYRLLNIRVILVLVPYTKMLCTLAACVSFTSFPYVRWPARKGHCMLVTICHLFLLQHSCVGLSYHSYLLSMH